ncbi:MAG: DUF58 domain-containing protein [Bacteriovoracaceae bacterium]|jgi:uncharacterized protein (DUF58 family)|nr:DUF58 domain-containing protein [Bacteriovoracaceae bacterium]
MDLKAVEKAAQRIQSQLFKNSNSYSIGMLKSHFRGSGLIFKEHQVYAHGDDVRFIDWKLLARTGNPYIKTFEEERNIEIIVVIDASLPMLYGHKGVSKLQMALEICCLLFLITKETNDYVQPIIVGEKINTLPMKTGKDGIVMLVAELQKMNLLDSEGRVIVPSSKTIYDDSDRKLKMLFKHLHKKKEIVLLSDFNAFLPIEEIKHLFYKKNLHCFQLISPLDEYDKMPYSVYAYNSGIEGTGEKVFNIDAQTKHNELKKLLGRKVKPLKLTERYLENFIKEML